MKKQSIRMPLSRKFALGFVLITVVICGLLCLEGCTDITRLYQQFYGEKATSAAQMAADIVTGEGAAHYLATLATDDAYDGLLARLSSVKDATGMAWLYVFYPAEDGYLYLFDAPGMNDAPEAVKAIGDRDAYSAGNTNMMRVMREGVAVSDLLVTNTKLGYVGTIFVPILDASGKSVALAGADVSMTALNHSLRSYLLRTLLLSVGAVVVILLAYLFFLRRSLVRPIKALTASVSGFIGKSGALPDYHPADIRTGDEVEVLGDAFTQMAEDLRQYLDNLQAVTAEKQRIKTELDIASHIQMSMLPRIFPPFPQRDDFTLYASIEPAKEVGGDFYDFFLLSEHQLCLLIADVSGKGVPAALFMMLAKALLKREMQRTGDLALSFNTVNDQMCEGNDECMFVTSLMFLVDTAAGTLSFVNAGHNPPLLRRAGEAFAYQPLRKSLPLAAYPNRRYQAETIPFCPGDTLLTYTDGVTEAMDADGALFGEARLLASLNDLPDDADAQAILRHLDGRLKAYVNGATQSDDITMLALHMTPAAGKDA